MKKIMISLRKAKREEKKGKGRGTQLWKVNR